MPILYDRHAKILSSRLPIGIEVLIAPLENFPKKGAVDVIAIVHPTRDGSLRGTPRLDRSKLRNYDPVRIGIRSIL